MKTIRLNDFKPLSEYEWGAPVFPGRHAGAGQGVRLLAAAGGGAPGQIPRAGGQYEHPAGILGWVSVMPDVHQGYGFPIGGVAATDVETGVVSPGGIGYDINCGVRLMASLLPAEAAKDG